MIALAFKLPAEDSPVSGSIRVLSVDITPERVDDAVAALRDLVGHLPDHPSVLPLIDVGLADGRLLLITPPVTGDPLDRALQLYGPAAVDDALPRVRCVASALDWAAEQGFCHGALQPRDIIVSPDATYVADIGVAGALAEAGVAGRPDPKYAAPEVLAGRSASPATDQFSLALIAHEWMFAGAMAPADGFLAVPTLTGIDARAMQRTFRIATQEDPSRRFANCLAFASALERCAAPGPDVIAPALDEWPLRNDADDRKVTSRVLSDAPASRTLLALPSESRQTQYSVLAMVTALVVGMALGAGGMRLMSGAPASQPFEENNGGRLRTPMAQLSAESTGPTEVIDLPVTPPRDDLAVDFVPDAPPASDATAVSQSEAGLLIHSSPEGANVSVDGVARGTTPVALRGLTLGTRRVRVSRPGYVAAERLVTLTSERPSRTLDVELARLAGPASPVAPAPVNGSLVVDSRPAGALVSVDGQSAGSTPLTLTSLRPGRHTVRIERAGYRTVTTTVDVKAGERARVAARLEGGSNEE